MAVLDLDYWLEEVKNKRALVPAHLLKQICEKLKEILVKESNVVHIQAPVSVVGDVHSPVIAAMIFVMFVILL